MPGGEPQPNPSRIVAPSTINWRRQRLMNVGSSGDLRDLDRSTDSISAPDSSETATLRAGNSRSYGTVPSPRRRNTPKSTSSRNNSLPFLQMPSKMGPSDTPLGSPRSNLSVLRSFSQRPISAYDSHLVENIKSETIHDTDIDAKINGIRVWYNSFSSIDWLHDAIKDSVRFSRLRRRKSFRAKLELLFDRSLGWIIVTIVGFLTAIVAFLVVRTEQLLFDLKEGHCGGRWLTAKRFCCPSGTEHCSAWETWPEFFTMKETDPGAQSIEYVSYTTIALTLAFLSSVLTVYLTNSTTFTTRKESGVLSPEYDETSKDPASAGPKRKVMYYAAGSGIPEIKTILSGFVIHGYLGGRTLFTKALGLSLSVASGLSLGKEGPFVHIASCVGNIVSRFHSKYENNEAKRREVLSAACAAGVAVAFGAPIGGTLFSLEEVSYFFPPKVMWRSFFCAMIAAISLKLLDPFGTGKLVLFQVTYDKDWHALELLPFLLLGVFGGVYGAYFSKLNYRWSKHVRNTTWLKTNPIKEVLLITLLTSVICFVNPYTRMGGTELVYNLFAECKEELRDNHGGLCILDRGDWAHVWPVAQAILVAMVVKGGLTVITFGIKVPAGIFIPTLGVGACAGRVVGLFVQYWQHSRPDSPVFAACNGDMHCIIPGLYAMIGAAATLAGATRTTVSLAVIMFELTDTLTYAVPIMLSVLVAKTVADALEPKGIYDLVIELNQLPFLDTKHEYLWGNFQVGDVVSREVEVIRVDNTNTVKSLRDQLQKVQASGSDDNGLPILRSDGDGIRLTGYIGANELEHALSIVADAAEDPVFFNTTHGHLASSSFSSITDFEHAASDPFDFSMYIDQAPLTLQSNSPLEMVHQFFVKLGAKYIVILDSDGSYEGVIDKKTWLAFLNELEEKS